jgi:hypothetical protein
MYISVIRFFIENPCFKCLLLGMIISQRTIQIINWTPNFFYKCWIVNIHVKHYKQKETKKPLTRTRQLVLKQCQQMLNWKQ